MLNRPMHYPFAVVVLLVVLLATASCSGSQSATTQGAPGTTSLVSTTVSANTEPSDSTGQQGTSMTTGAAEGITEPSAPTATSASRAIDGGPRGTWTRHAATASTPSPRVLEAAAYAENIDRLLVFGGTLLDSNGQLADNTDELWAYNPSADTWDRQDSGATVPPAGRVASLMGYDAKTGQLLVFGGRDDLGADLDGTWAFDPLAGTWTELHPATSPPGGGQYGGMVYDSAGGRLLLLWMGEDANQGPEVWSFDFAAGAWGKIETVGQAPPFRKSPSVLWAEDIGRLLMIGGAAPEGAADDVWLFDPTSGTWAQQARLPKAIIGDVSLGKGQMAAYDPQGKRAILCTTERTTNPETYTFKTFSFSPSTGEWADLQPAGATPPTLLKVASLTYDSNTRSLILYGGVTGSDTYVQNRDVWIFAPPAAR